MSYLVDCREFYGNVIQVREAICPLCSETNYEIYIEERHRTLRTCKHFRGIQTGLVNEFRFPDRPDAMLFGKEKKRK